MIAGYQGYWKKPEPPPTRKKRILLKLWGKEGGVGKRGPPCRGLDTAYTTRIHALTGNWGMSQKRIKINKKTVREKTWTFMLSIRRKRSREDGVHKMPC